MAIPILVQPVLRVECPISFVLILGATHLAFWRHERRTQARDGVLIRDWPDRITAQRALYAALAVFALLAPSERSLLRKIDRDILASDSAVSDEEWGSQGFAMVGLSNIAEACTSLALAQPRRRDEMIARQERIIDLVLGDTQLRGLIDDYRTHPDEQVILGHFNLILGAYHRLKPDSAHTARNRELSAWLSEISVRSPDAHLHPYTGVKAKFPADQITVLHSLWLADKNFSTDFHARPLEKWLRVMNERYTHESGLHRSAVIGWNETGPWPRGCALSWSVRYMSAFAPAEAAAQYALYRRTMGDSWGYVAAFREYPAGYDGPADADSGPIVPHLGWGAAATAFGVGAARAQGDWLRYYQLLNLQHMGEAVIALIPKSGSAELRAFDRLATAIAINQRTTRRWYDE